MMPMRTIVDLPEGDLYGMRLPDALIWASAQHESALLVSRNTRDFPADAPGVRVPYQL